jgi:HD-GYP domain-containing protein (c-di-GMP phosphodiesterase class II)
VIRIGQRGRSRSSGQHRRSVVELALEVAEQLGLSGGGYPDGLAGEQISLEARIIACCDSWNAMRTDRVYRKALPF